MPDFGSIQPRKFLLDSSEENGRILGNFRQNNNRYLCTIELTDNSVPAIIPDGAEVVIKCRQNKEGSPVYILDSNSPDYSTKVSYQAGTNVIKVDRWAALVAHDGNMLIGVTIGGMSSYTGSYMVAKDKMSGREAYHPGQPLSGLAKIDLSNVSKKSILDKAKEAGLMQNDMADVDLIKLADKVMDSDVGSQIKQLTRATSDLANPSTFDHNLKSNAAFIALQNKHPATSGMTPSQIKSLFYANRYEETGPVDLTKEPYSDAKVLLMVYQLTSTNQVITQQMPPVANDQVIMVDVLRSPGITGGKVVFTPGTGDALNGATQPVEVSRDGYNGFWIPYDNEGSYDWYGTESTQESTLTVSDERGNVSVGVKTLNFKSGSIEDDGSGTVNVIPGDTGGVSFLDGITGKEFKPGKVKSLDQSIRIAEMQDGTADLSVDLPHIKEGVFATLGYPEPINTNFHDQRPYFTPRYSHTQRYVGLDRDDKAFTLQDGSMDDPNVTGGSAFHLGMWFDPTGSPVATADGYVELKVIDVMTGEYLVQPDGKVLSVRRDYLQGQVIGQELLVGAYMAKGQQKVAFEVDCSFPGQIITASPYTCIYIQQVDGSAGTGLAEMCFMQYTGVVIRGADRYYGYNLMNFAAALTKTKGVETLPGGQNELLGNGLFVDARTNVNMAISDNKLTIMGDGVSIPVFSVGQILTPVQSLQLHLKNLATRVKLQDKNNAFDYALMKWTKETPANLPILTGYQNDQPIFADGWVQVSKKFISEDVVSGIHEDSNSFTVPEDAKQVALILYPAVSQIPTTLILADFEADVTPAFTIPTLSSTFPPKEMHLQYMDYLYRSITSVPPGNLELRYTINSSETKLPFGIVSGGDGKLVNDRSWNTSGNTWDFEGDGKFKSDGKATIDYDIPSIYCGEKAPDSGSVQCSLWMAKSQPDGSFVEIPGSRVDFMVDKAFKGAKHVTSNKFKLDVKDGDSIRLFSKSSVDDGCYLQSGTDGRPLIRINVDFDELEEIDQRIIDLIQNGK